MSRKWVQLLVLLLVLCLAWMTVVTSFLLSKGREQMAQGVEGAQRGLYEVTLQLDVPAPTDDFYSGHSLLELAATSPFHAGDVELVVREHASSVAGTAFTMSFILGTNVPVEISAEDRAGWERFLAWYDEQRAGMRWPAQDRLFQALTNIQDVRALDAGHGLVLRRLRRLEWLELIDAQGEVVWSVVLDDHLSGEHGSTYDLDGVSHTRDTVFIRGMHNQDGEQHLATTALDLSNGSVRWRNCLVVPSGYAGVRGAPRIAAGQVLVDFGMLGRVRSVDAATGETQWEAQTNLSSSGLVVLSWAVAVYAHRVLLLLDPGSGQELTRLESSNCVVTLDCLFCGTDGELQRWCSAEDTPPTADLTVLLAETGCDRLSLRQGGAYDDGLVFAVDCLGQNPRILAMEASMEPFAITRHWDISSLYNGDITPAFSGQLDRFTTLRLTEVSQLAQETPNPEFVEAMGDVDDILEEAIGFDLSMFPTYVHHLAMLDLEQRRIHWILPSDQFDARPTFRVGGTLYSASRSQLIAMDPEVGTIDAAIHFGHEYSLVKPGQVGGGLVWLYVEDGFGILNAETLELQYASAHFPGITDILSTLQSADQLTTD